MFVLASLAVARPPRDFELTTAYKYHEYVKDHGKTVTPNSTEWQLREEIFNTRVREFVAFNKGGRPWKKGVNKFTDMTEKERKAFLGGRPRFNRAYGLSAANIHRADPKATLPDHVDWRTKNILTSVKDQASCGSCWAHAAIEAIEASAAKNSAKPPVELSRQQLVSCVQNPKHCGGTGGCSGATAELGFAYAASVAGITTEAAYPYTSGGGDSGSCTFDPATTPVAAKVLSYTSANVNDVNSTLSLIANYGPAAIGVAASAWFDYSSGVFDECENSSDQDMNHGVQVVGYSSNYFIVRNSWGSGWGEGGFIRLHRVDKCYTDNEPKDGSACDGDPATATVCGPCGLYYEVSWPVCAPGVG